MSDSRKSSYSQPKTSSRDTNQAAPASRTSLSSRGTSTKTLNNGPSTQPIGEFRRLTRSVSARMAAATQPISSNPNPTVTRVKRAAEDSTDPSLIHPPNKFSKVERAVQQPTKTSSVSAAGSRTLNRSSSYAPGRLGGIANKRTQNLPGRSLSSREPILNPNRAVMETKKTSLAAEGKKGKGKGKQQLETSNSTNKAVSSSHTNHNPNPLPPVDAPVTSTTFVRLPSRIPIKKSYTCPPVSISEATSARLFLEDPFAAPSKKSNLPPTSFHVSEPSSSRLPIRTVSCTNRFGVVQPPSGLTVRPIIDLSASKRHRKEGPDWLLPSFNVPQDELKRINGQSLDDLLMGKYEKVVSEIVVIDCRSEYEYEGGHIKGAVNVETNSVVDQFFFGQDGVRMDLDEIDDGKVKEKEVEKKKVLVFHCEFSSVRGPATALYLRETDRQLHGTDSKDLIYSEVYVLEGGYKAYHVSSPEHCEGRHLPMPCEFNAGNPNFDINQFRLKERDGFRKKKTYSLFDANGTLMMPFNPHDNSSPSTGLVPVEGVEMLGQGLSSDGVEVPVDQSQTQAQVQVQAQPQSRPGNLETRSQFFPSLQFGKIKDQNMKRD